MKELAGSGMTMVVITHEIGFAREVGERGSCSCRRSSEDDVELLTLLGMEAWISSRSGFDPLDRRDGVQIPIERCDTSDVGSLGRGDEIRVVEGEPFGLEQLDRAMQQEWVPHGDRRQRKERTSSLGDLPSWKPVVRRQDVDELGEDHIG